MLAIAVAAQAIVPARADGRDRKFALLIQNDSYADAEPAAIAGDDAATLAAVLRRDGFEVELKRNLRRREMQASIAAFVAKATEGSRALLYYKGIGIQVSRLDYLVPVDASIWSEDDVRRDGTSLDRVMIDLGKRGAGVKMAIVDAARPNPFERRFRSYSAGLAPLSARPGSLVIFADAVNHVAEPGNAPVSPFMRELVAQLAAGRDAEAAFARTRQAVSKASSGRQTPWVSSTLARTTAVAAVPANPMPAKPAPAKPAPVVAPPPAAAKPPAIPAPKPAQEAPVTPKPAAQAAPPRPRPGDTFGDCRRCPEMAVIAAATFTMGSGTTPFDRPVHGVTIKKPFAIGVSAVTRDEWALCVEDGGCPAKAAGGADGGTPVVDVDWSEAEKYAAFLSRKSGKPYRLPTEAEWEYAARGGTRTAFAWGDAAGVGHANCTDCGAAGGAGIAPARRFPRNGFGLYDMAGNVAEWLQDCWTLTYRGAPADGSAPAVASCKMRVVRGGSYATTSAYIKPTARFRAEANARSPSIGFRVARDVE